MTQQPDDLSQISRRNGYNSQFLFDATAAVKKPKPKVKSPKRLTFFTATAASLFGAIIGASVGAGTGVIAYNYLSQPSAVIVNDTESVNWVTAAAAIASPSVVTIRIASDISSGNGSGVVLSEDGYILTNAHVVSVSGTTNGVSITVRTSDGGVFPAKLIGGDSTNDLAVIKIEPTRPLIPIEFADSAMINVGDQVVAIGAPLGLEATVTKGIVSALNRTIQVASSEGPNGLELWSGNSGRPINLAVLQTDAAINPGNSGGALVDDRGRLVGINVAIATAGGYSQSGNIGVGFAIPANIASRIASEIIATGAASHGMLGVLVSDSYSSEDQSAFPVAVLVIEVTEGSAAQQAGLRAGDIITHFKGSPVTTANELNAAVRQEPAGAKVTMDILRDGVKLTLSAVLQDSRDAE